MEKSAGSCSSNDNGRNCYRGHWRPAEDENLRQLVQQFGPQNWNFIAEHLQGRSGKSCRLRWYNQLDPNINKKPFTEEEEEKLLAAHRIYGNKWACIAKYFQGRTDNSVKNHFHVVMARKRRERFTLSHKPFLNYYQHPPTTTPPPPPPPPHMKKPRLGFQAKGTFGIFSSNSSTSCSLNDSTLINNSKLSLNVAGEGRNYDDNRIGFGFGFGFGSVHGDTASTLLKSNYGYRSDVHDTSKSKFILRHDGDYNSDTFQKGLVKGNSEKDNAKEVAFIDFLGVGIS